MTQAKRSLVAPSLVLLWASALAAAPPKHSVEEETERSRLVESVLQRAETAAQREFDPSFRKAALESLSALPVDELEGREAAGTVGPLAVGASRAQLVYTPLTPCRIMDTRHANGSLQPGQPRFLRVAGIGLQGQGGPVEGCGVPFGPATAVVINFTATRPLGPGYLRVWPYRFPAEPPPPNVSLLNYDLVSSNPNLNIGGTIVTAICDPAEAGQSCPIDFQVQAEGNVTHIVAEVVGYFERFPKEEVRSFSVTAPFPPTERSVPTWCNAVSAAWIDVDAPVAGRVVVRGTVRGQVHHAQGLADALTFGISVAPDNCAYEAPSGHGVPASLPTDKYDFNAPVVAQFAVSAGTHRYYLTAQMLGGANFGRITQWFLEATYHPN